ncbi:hypothetical protein [Thiomonas intermedia]|uniref:COG4648 family protein n=1 Tax=Thiomonas intermedia TaxID=926 RepID=UPI0009A4C3E3|nr:hypothetical protein [Thiomonas intermedia]
MNPAARAGWLPRALIGILLAAFPVLSFIGARLPEPNAFGAAAATAPTLLMVTWMAWQAERRAVALFLLVLLLGAMWSQRALLLRHYNLAFLAEYAGMMGLLAWVFGRTLLEGQTPLVSRFALMAHGTLSPLVRHYTRGVTWAWTLFFCLMAFTSILVFVITPLSLWAVFANVVSPLLMLAMFVGEYLVRRILVPAHERSGPIAAIRAYWHYNQHRHAAKVQPARARTSELR